MPIKHDICEICQQDLLYLDKPKEYKCFFCGNIKLTNIICPNYHYICDACHSKDAIEIILDFCKKTDLINPFEIADEIMKHPNFKVYGPEHHVLVPAAILTSLKNLEIKKPNGTVVSYGDILTAVQRAKKLPGGWCGFYGNCGAGVGSGIAISVFTSANPSTDKTRSLAIKTTSRSLSKIADNIEHCCKRSVRLSIIEALEILNENFNLNLHFQPKNCVFSDINDKCEKDLCPIFSINP
jgi:hypothetical protein